MRDRKLTMNGLIAILIAFSVIGLFATVSSLRMTDPSVMNEFYPVGDTGYSIRHSTFTQNGIVKGMDVNNAELVFPGNFGTDWGAVSDGDQLYVNLYTPTTIGILQSDVELVDLDALEETTLFENAILRGQCASGELVIVRGAMLPANKPEESVLCKFYAMSAGDLSPDGRNAEVLFYDIGKGEVVYRIAGEAAFSEDFEARFLDKTLEEVQACE